MRKLAGEQAEIFRIFSNEKRILIFWLLLEREMSVNEIAESVGTSIQNTSQHLRLMKSKGILDTRRDGQTIYYYIADNDIGRYCKLIHQENVRKLNTPGEEYRYQSSAY